MSVQRPRRVTNRLSAAINVGVDKSDASSMCTAVVAIHTNMHKYALVTRSRRNRATFTSNGPAKSTPTFPNYLICSSRCRGKSSMRG